MTTLRLALLGPLAGMTLAACSQAEEAAPANDIVASEPAMAGSATGGDIPTPPTLPPSATQTPDQARVGDACGASKVARWIGEEATVPVRVAVARAADAATDRWIYPDSVVTDDFRPERLNVVMERGTDRIITAKCG